MLNRLAYTMYKEEVKPKEPKKDRISDVAKKALDHNKMIKAHIIAGKDISELKDKGISLADTL